MLQVRKRSINCCVFYYFLLKWQKGILTLPEVMKLRDTQHQQWLLNWNTGQ